MLEIKEVTPFQFDEAVLKADRPVLVAFFSPWCGSCRKLEPVLEALAAKFENRIKFAKVDVEDHPHLANLHQVDAVPTLILFRDGEIIHRVEKLVSLGWLEAVLERVTAESHAETLAVA